MNGQVTFWKSDFVGDNYEQLLSILKQYACKGEGYWFVNDNVQVYQKIN